MKLVLQRTEHLLLHLPQTRRAQLLPSTRLYRYACSLQSQRPRGRQQAGCIEAASFGAQQISRRQQHVLIRNVSTAATAIDALVHANVAGPGDNVLVHYCGTLDDDSVFDSSHEREPLEFIVGTGKVIPGFDNVVIGMVKGERRKERVTPDQAYGEWRSEMTIRVPLKDIPPDTKLKEGDNVRLSNGSTAIVKETTADDIMLDFNPPMAGKALTFEVELLKITKASHLHKATFGGGCFWGPELLFQRVPGVVATEVGYSQGSWENPTYEDVCTGDTGHTEVVQVTFDGSLVTYEELLKAFWRHIDPCTENGQGADRGSQYRTGIYAHNEEQRRLAESSKRNLQVVTKMQDPEAPVPIRTEVEDLKNYHKAEDYHQQYLAKGGRFGNAQSPAKGVEEPIRCYG